MPPPKIAQGLWTDALAPAFAQAPAASGFTLATFDGNIQLYAANNSGDKTFVVIQFPHSVSRESQTLDLHVHWTFPTNPTAGKEFTWAFEYVRADIGGTFSGTTITATAYTAVGNEAKKHLITQIGTIGPAVVGISQCLVGCLSVAYTATPGAQPMLISCDSHFQQGPLGSTLATSD